MAAMGKFAWTGVNPARVARADHQFSQIPEFSGVVRGRELTRKDRRIASGLYPVDELIQGGILRGRISEIISEPGAGKTSLAAAFAAKITRQEAAAWIEASDNFDPGSIAAAGVELTRLLWVSCRESLIAGSSSASGTTGVSSAEAGVPSEMFPGGRAAPAKRRDHCCLKAAEWILAAGGFGLVIVDFGATAFQLPPSTALRLARAAERSGAAVLVLAPHRMCGTFAALSFTLRRQCPSFSQQHPGGPRLFDGLTLEAFVARNKMGGSDQTAHWKAVTEMPDESARIVTRPLDSLPQTKQRIINLLAPPLTRTGVSKERRRA
jgi:hypothetical protein